MYYPQRTQPIPPPPPPQSMPIAPQPQAYQPPPPQWPQQYMYPPYLYTYPIGMPMPMPYPYIPQCWGPTPMCYPQMPYMQPLPQMPPQQLQQVPEQLQLPQQQIQQFPQQPIHQVPQRTQQMPQHQMQQQTQPIPQQQQSQQQMSQQSQPQKQQQYILQQPVHQILEHVQPQPCIHSAQQQPHHVQLQPQSQSCAESQTMMVPFLHGATVHAGHPVSTRSQERNPMYADHSEHKHDLFGAPSTPLSLKISTQLPLHDSSHGLVSSQNELESNDTVVVSKDTDQQETGRELNTICFASGFVKECNSTIEENNASNSHGYCRTTMLTDSVIESAPVVEVNNASEGDRQNGATRVAWGVAIRDFPISSWW